MRSPKIIVVALACLAAGLLAAIAYTRPFSHATAAKVQPTAPPPAEVVSAKVGEPAAVPTAVAPPPTQAFSWRDIESEDYKTYIANLRGVGCPEKTIRDIIVADVNKLFASRENPLKSPPPPVAGEKSSETPEQKLERLRQLRAVQQEKRWVVKELLGVDIPMDLLPSSGSRDYRAFEVALRFVSEEKRDAVQSLQENYWQQSDALKAKYKGKPQELAAEARQLKDSLRQELTKLLTPQELEDYDIRTSSTAKQISDKLATYFQPSEDEFRKIYRARRDYEETISNLSENQVTPKLPTDDPEAAKAMAAQRAAERKAVQEARTAAQTQLNEQLKATLGDNRYAEYERSQDRTYDLLARLGMRYNLPPETVLEAYETQKSFQTGAPALPGEARDANARAELQRQLNEKMTAILGEKAALGYKRVNGGNIPVR